jgi:hypothetical protein
MRNVTESVHPDRNRRGILLIEPGGQHGHPRAAGTGESAGTIHLHIVVIDVRRRREPFADQRESIRRIANAVRDPLRDHQLVARRNGALGASDAHDCDTFENLYPFLDVRMHMRAGVPWTSAGLHEEIELHERPTVSLRCGGRRRSI